MHIDCCGARLLSHSSSANVHHGPGGFLPNFKRGLESSRSQSIALFIRLAHGKYLALALTFRLVRLSVKQLLALANRCGSDTRLADQKIRNHLRPVS